MLRLSVVLLLSAGVALSAVLPAQRETGETQQQADDVAVAAGAKLGETLAVEKKGEEARVEQRLEASSVAPLRSEEPTTACPEPGEHKLEKPLVEEKENKSELIEEHLSTAAPQKKEEGERRGLDAATPVDTPAKGEGKVTAVETETKAEAKTPVATQQDATGTNNAPAAATGEKTAEALKGEGKTVVVQGQDQPERKEEKKEEPKGKEESKIEMPKEEKNESKIMEPMERVQIQEAEHNESEKAEPKKAEEEKPRKEEGKEEKKEEKKEQRKEEEKKEEEQRPKLEGQHLSTAAPEEGRLSSAKPEAEAKKMEERLSSVAPKLEEHRLSSEAPKAEIRQERLSSLAPEHEQEGRQSTQAPEAVSRHD